MRRLTPLLAALATATAAVVTLGLTTVGASAAVSARAGAAGHDDLGPAARPLPHQVFAPYYETYDTSGDLAAQSQQSGARFLSLAFLETATSGSCTAYWDGDTSQPIAASSYGADIAEIQSHGGNVIPSFGGYTADTTNTDIADSCTSVPGIAAERSCSCRRCRCWLCRRCSRRTTGSRCRHATGSRRCQRRSSTPRSAGWCLRPSRPCRSRTWRSRGTPAT